MSEALILDVKSKMTNTIEYFREDISGMRTNRAHSGLVSGLMVNYHGTQMKISELGQISVSDGSMILIQLWDKSAVTSIAFFTSSVTLDCFDAVAASSPARNQYLYESFVNGLRLQEMSGPAPFKAVFVTGSTYPSHIWHHICPHGHSVQFFFRSASLRRFL